MPRLQLSPAERVFALWAALTPEGLSVYEAMVRGALMERHRPATDSTPETPKRAGRPPGSRNKPKTELPAGVNAAQEAGL
jgi:hypothetical protein